MQAISPEQVAVHNSKEIVDMRATETTDRPIAGKNRPEDQYQEIDCRHWLVVDASQITSCRRERRGGDGS